MSSQRKQPTIKITKNDEFRELFASGVFGGMNPNKCSMVFFNDKPQLNIVKANQFDVSEVKRELLTEIIVTPVQFKSIAKWMARNIKAYENRFGEITLRKEKESPEMRFIS
ncbi:MAG: DUF3467 domain-containing protein [Promethearchaeota archaeon]|jgi:hypothetical protein